MSELSGCTTRAAPRRTLDIEAALQWAYRDELPKRREDRPLRGIGYPSTHPIWRAGAFGGRIDCWNRDPGFPLALGDPSPDALRIEAAVEALDDAALDILPYDVGQGLGDHVDLRHVISITRRDVRSWIVTYARNGKRPDLGGPADFEPVRGANGKAEIWETVSIPAGEGPDGTPWFTTFDRRTSAVRAGTYPDGAFCKLQWVRTADDVAEDRARYALWHAGLAALTEILAPVLQDVAIVPSAAVARPWVESEPAPPTIRPNLARRTAALDQRRPVARRPPGRRPEPVRFIQPGEWKPAGAA